MTPQQCLETRLRLGWSREQLASASGLAAPILRLFEAGALEGFDQCQQAIESALAEADARTPARHVAPPRNPRGAWKRHSGLAEASVRWRGRAGAVLATA